MNPSVFQFTFLLVDLWIQNSTPVPSRFEDVTNFDDRKFVEFTQRALNEIKVFVYPQPIFEDLRKYVPFCSIQFHAEKIIPSYFKSSSMFTNNPADADFFLIEHDFTCLFVFGQYSAYNMSEHQYKYEKVYERHMKPIFDHVVYSQPYFNRSGGKDHLVLFTYDNGPFCQYYEPYFGKLFNSIFNKTTLILNFGLSGYEFNYKQLYGKKAANFDGCIRQHNQDIIIPQYHDYPLHRNLSDIYRLREYSAFFKGEYSNRGPSSPFIREFLSNFKSNHSLKFFNVPHAWHQGASAMISYFSLCPAGYAPWSIRLYDSLFHLSVPVILANRILLPFEKFLNWKSFTVKIDTDLIGTTNYSFLETMHSLSEEYRTALLKHRRANKDTSLHGKTLPSTYMWSKLYRVWEASKWLTWETEPGRKRSIWALLAAELWCRSKHALHNVAMSNIYCHSNYSTVSNLTYW